MRRVMAVGDVLLLQSALRPCGAGWCVVGGWGVDALLRVETRPHKDLDVLVNLDLLRSTLDVLREQGFTHAYAWEESVPLRGPVGLAGLDSAFVMNDVAGREVDIHVYEDDGARIIPLWDTHRVLATSDLAAEGVIGGEVVTCLTAERQLEFHTGYELPEPQRLDVEHLARLLGS